MASHESSLHDWLAVGEVNVALSSANTTMEEQEDASLRKRREETLRLPLFLRLLSASQPHSSVPSLTSNDLCKQEDDISTDILVDQVVSKLEDVAATYSAAEGVDALTHYAPTICRRISRLAPLKQDKRTRTWNTEELTSVASSPLIYSPRKRARMNYPQEEEETSRPKIGSEDEDDGDITSMRDSLPPSSHKVVKSKAEASAFAEPKDSKTIPGTEEDSLEATVISILQEISKLVLESLKPATAQKEDEDGGECNVSIPVKTDSLLSEIRSCRDDTERDLGTTIVALMHHAPVLRYRHVANALCRAALPQTTHLVEMMGANCPTAVPCLLKGCIDAFVQASDKNHLQVAKKAKAAVRALAHLSHREACRVRTSLEQSNLMLDVQLELAIDQDAIAVACLLNRYLSSDDLWRIRAKQDDTRERQVPGETHDLSKSDIKVAWRPLSNCLRENQTLSTKAFTCVLEALHAAMDDSSAFVPLGRVVLLLRSLSWLMLSTRHIPILSRMPVILNLLQNKLFRVDIESMKPRVGVDVCYGLLLCDCLILCTLSDDETRSSSQHCLENVLLTKPVSLQSAIFRSCVAGLLQAQDSARMHKLILDALMDRGNSLRASIIPESTSGLYLGTCQWASKNMDLKAIMSPGRTVEAVLEDPSALLQAIELGQIEESEYVEVLRNILQEPERCSTAMEQDGVIDLLSFSLTASTCEGKLPLILPVQLQVLCEKIDWTKPVGSSGTDKSKRQFLLQLLYSFRFLEHEPLSPFAIDPRDLPLPEIYHMCSGFSGETSSGLTSVTSSLMTLIRAHAPEAPSQVNAFHKAGLPEGVSRKSLKDSLIRAIQRSMETEDLDPSGIFAESAVVRAGAVLTSNEVDTACASALLSSPHVPLPYARYSSLCRDPLVLLKCHVSVWRSLGLRRITLSLLWRLLEANTHIVLENTPEETAQQLLAARDAIVTRCLLVLTCGGGSEVKAVDTLRPFQCNVVTGTIRALVSRQRGLAAALIRQGLPDSSVDWLIEFVPELINEAAVLTALLTGRSSLSAFERLVLADVSLRIAVVQGVRDESEAVPLACASLNALISSFYLIIGPVGVPVNVVCEEDGLDITQVCRSATFRMLKALHRIPAERVSLRTECSRALQKLAGLCKGESILSGVTGAREQQRRKKLVSSIWDAATKANTAMGTL